MQISWGEAQSLTNNKRMGKRSYPFFSLKTEYGDLDGVIYFCSTHIPAGMNRYYQVVYFKHLEFVASSTRNQSGEVGKLEKYFKEIRIIKKIKQRIPVKIKKTQKKPSSTRAFLSAEGSPSPSFQKIIIK